MIITLNKKHKALLALVLLVAVMAVVFLSVETIQTTGQYLGQYLFDELNVVSFPKAF